MPRTVELLLTENVDSLGIVGDVVDVRPGYARNYLLPLGMATIPSDEAKAELAEKRKEAERMLAEQRAQREKMVGKLEGFELTLERSCNDMGMLYGSVTQRDVAAALAEKGYTVKPREVRLTQAIKRVDDYDVPIRFDQDLETTIKVRVAADRDLPIDEQRVELDIDEEGNVVGVLAPESELEHESPAEAKAENEAEAEGEARAETPEENKPSA